MQHVAEKKIIPVLIAGLLFLLTIPVQARLSVSATITNDFIHRGVSLARDGIVYQANIELQSERGWYIGAWTSRVNSNTDKRKSETDFFAGYQRRWNGWLGTDFTYVRYTYDEKVFGRNYDWNELQLAIHITDRWSLLFGAGKNWLGSDAYSHIVEGAFRQALPLGVVGYASIGRQYANNVSGDEYWYGEIGIARTFNNFDVRVGYTDVSNYGGHGRAVSSKVVAAFTYTIDIF